MLSMRAKGVSLSIPQLVKDLSASLEVSARVCVCPLAGLPVLPRQRGAIPHDRSHAHPPHSCPSRPRPLQAAITLEDAIAALQLLEGEPDSNIRLQGSGRVTIIR